MLVMHVMDPESISLNMMQKHPGWETSLMQGTIETSSLTPRKEANQPVGLFLSDRRKLTLSGVKHAQLHANSILKHRIEQNYPL